MNITAKIRDELLGCIICNITLTSFSPQFVRKSEKWKRYLGNHKKGSVHSVLICKASTNGGWRFRMTSISQQKSEMSYWVVIFVITLQTLFSPQFIRKDEEWKMSGECDETENQGSVQYWFARQAQRGDGGLRWPTSGTNHMQFHKIIFSALQNPKPLVFLGVPSLMFPGVSLVFPGVGSNFRGVPSCSRENVLGNYYL